MTTAVINTVDFIYESALYDAGGSVSGVSNEEAAQSRRQGSALERMTGSPFWCLCPVTVSSVIVL